MRPKEASRWVGPTLSFAGLVWLGAVGMLESGAEIEAAAVRLAFAVSGTLVCLAMLRWRAQLQERSARAGTLVVAVATATTAVGLSGAEIVGDLGFLLGYSGILFVLPVGLIILGVGLWREAGVVRWARWVPIAQAVVAAVTYGFHAAAPAVWDPPDAVLFVVYGVGWILLGVAAARRP